MVFLHFHFDAVRRFDSREGHVKLAMGEDRFWQIESNSVKSLPLRLVDCHGEGEAQRELTSREVDREEGVGRGGGDAWNEHLLPLLGHCCYSALNDALLEGSHHHPRPIAEPTFDVQVSQAHNDGAQLKIS